MSVEAILAELVAIPSVCRTPTAAITDYICAYLARYGVKSTLLPGPEGDRANLFARIGPAGIPGYILSAHVDVVPASPNGWGGDPFRLREDGARLLGRGSVDMKGFIACVLASVPVFLSRPLRQPVHIALSYDEEVGCVGVRHLLASLPSLCAPALGCIVGEPTVMRPVLRHKGKAALRVTVRGRAGHSSRPDLADNAIHPAADLIVAIRDAARDLAANGPFDGRFEPPYSTMQVGTVQGGVGVNVVPERCVFDLEARAIPADVPTALLDPLHQAISRERLTAETANRHIAIETELLSEYPALDLADDHPLVAWTESLSGLPRQAAVSFGTEAGLYQAAGIPAVVCGPGDVTRAHQPDEYILREELAQGVALLTRMAERLAA
jgi:acetylornithine deacetylase